MLTSTAYEGKRIGVFGLARTGRAAARALSESGAHVLAWDDDTKRLPEFGDMAVDLYKTDFAGLDALVMSPGVPLTHPAPHFLVKKAQAAGCPIIGDIELFAWARESLPDHSVVAITGTNGKSTTTALMCHISNECGLPAVMAGNIGTPVMSIEPLRAPGVYIFEMSSFQIDLTHSLDADIAILLNISSDHMDRHGSMARYVQSKQRLFDMQSAGHAAVIGVDDIYGRELAGRLRQRVVPVSVLGQVDGGVWVDEYGLLEDDITRADRAFDITDCPALAGRHNWQNAAAAYAAGCLLGLDPGSIVEAFQSFPGLSHRMEPVAEINGVRYINDSKATNPAAAARAIEAFDNVHWIVGGRPKDADLDAVRPYFSHIRHAWLIGEAAPVFAKALADVPHARVDTVERAVSAAARAARPGEVVLLSPACASFDQFTDFEARGDAFRCAVRALDGEATS